MGTLAPRVEQPRAVDVWFRKGKLHVALEDGREIACPLAMYPRLAAATGRERGTWVLTGGGEGIHWPDVDEDLSVRGLLNGKPAVLPEPSVMAARGAYLQAARKAARMTQAELAEAMGKSQALVSLAEKGRTWTGEPYRLEVLRACQLPDDWHP
jgi:hypothetical protein